MTGGPGPSPADADPRRSGPTVGELDLHLLGEGRHRRLWEVLGAHVREVGGVTGTSFAVWAPAARGLSVVGDHDGWDGRRHPMRALGGSGVWELFLPGVGPGARYQYEVVGADGERRRRADPFANATSDAGAVSVVHRSTHVWGDEAWLAQRAAVDPLRRPLSIYEVHLGSWRRGLTYRELADQLVPYVVGLGFTHVELLPVAEHPYDPSWGYQVTGQFAPTARFGGPDDFRALVDACHVAGLGVLVDWVPAHFPRDEWALVRFDGTALYEHADPQRAEHPDWGTLEFDLGRPEVRNSLVASAQYWLEELHVDGLRVDAVASMLYLDYSRGEGQWEPNRLGGREDLEAVAFLREVNEVVHETPGVLTVAEESTTWPGVSAPTGEGGLGFDAKWDMGWMHDTLDYFALDPVHRRWSHRLLTFGLTYVFGERYVLPLSHDEVVHEKRSLLSKMPGDRWQQLANLRALLAWMWCHPGAPLLFMGGELGQEREWSEGASLDWHLLEDGGHAGLTRLVGDLNRLRAAEPALWSGAFDPAGFRWLDADDAEQSCYSFLRLPVGAGAGRPLACLANLTPVPRHGYRVGLPEAGRWSVLLDTDAGEYAGSGLPVGSAVATEPLPWHGLDHSALVTLPPLALLWLAPEAEHA